MMLKNPGHIGLVVVCAVLLQTLHEGSAESYQEDLVLTLKQKQLVDKVAYFFYLPLI